MTDVNAPIELKAGEYRIYTSVQLSTPDFVDIKENDNNDLFNELLIYPNPATNRLSISVNMKNESLVNADVYDLQGRLVSQLFENNLTKGYKTVESDISALEQGLYFVAITVDGQRKTQKLLVK